MMLPIGRGRKAAFTLIEILLTVIILSTGTLFIFRSFFTSLGALERSSQEIQFGFFREEKIWQGKDLFRRDPAFRLQERGLADIRGKEFEWRLSSHPLLGRPNLYGIELVIYEPESRRRVSRSLRYIFISPEED